MYLLSRGPLSGLLRRAVSVTMLVAADVAGLALGLYLALVLRSVVYGDTVYWSILWDTGPAEWLPFLAPITVLVFLQAGLYAPRERRSGSGRILGALVLVALIVLAFGLGTDYDFTTTGLIPTAVATSALSIGLLRAAYDSVSLELMGRAGVRRRLLLVGEEDTLSDLERQLRASRGGIGVEVVGTLAAAPGSAALGASLEQLAVLLDDRRPDELVLAEADFDEQTVLEVVQLAHRHGVKVQARPDHDRAARPRGRVRAGPGRAAVRAATAGADGARVGDRSARSTSSSPSRSSSSGCRSGSLVAAAIKLDSRGPVLYVDRRIGRRRAGVRDAQVPHDGGGRGRAARPSSRTQNEASGALFKIRDDPRVTRVGRVLRRLSLDELPQLVNVLRGEMSLVGPRPLPLRDYALLEDWHRARYLVLPGMTGLWQISGRSGLEFDDLVRLDFTYLENWSIWLDVSIIVRTIPAVLSGRGAY